MYQRCIRGRPVADTQRRSDGMGWKATGAPTVRKQRDKWVVRVDGIDTATGQAPSTPARHVRVAARGPGGGSFRAGRPAQHRTRHGQLARAPLRRRSNRHHPEVARELRVGDPAHRGRARRHPACPASTAMTSPSGSNVSLPPASSRDAVCRSAARCCGPRSPRPSTRDHPAQPGRPGRPAPHRRQAGQGQGDRRCGTPPM